MKTLPVVHSEGVMDRELLMWKVWSPFRTAVLVETPLLTGLPAANQLTSAKGTD